jgi:hypothetical protein
VDDFSGSTGYVFLREMPGGVGREDVGVRRSAGRPTPGTEREEWSSHGG